MSEFLKALESLPPIKPKVHTVCISGQNVVVTLEKKLEVQRHSEDAYHWISPTEFALRPPPKPKTQYSVLKKTKKGYSFEQGDIHWPNNIVKGGETWLLEKE
jgi:hypothetical protein